MRPEAEPEAREVRGRGCHCPVDGPRRPSPPCGPESPTPWRPWVQTRRDARPTRTGSPHEPGASQHTSRPKGAFGFQHPVRLYLPVSKRQEYLQSSGEKVLASFPVQATIHFYNDASDDDDDEDEDEQGEEARPCDLRDQRPKAAPEGRAETGCRRE
ncbi:PREDICTED: protein ripply3 [Condylura cristata]|uniref:protein ripply3 n=1 Tax=Condylura cristata TaxID=143302 RepID=UPI000642B5B5|nr:PREDICTED: protein ripply3 [Condylura cristata]